MVVISSHIMVHWWFPPGLGKFRVAPTSTACYRVNSWTPAELENSTLNNLMQRTSRHTAVLRYTANLIDNWWIIFLSVEKAPGRSIELAKWICLQKNSHKVFKVLCGCFLLGSTPSFLVCWVGLAFAVITVSLTFKYLWRYGSEWRSLFTTTTSADYLESCRTAPTFLEGGQCWLPVHFIQKRRQL